MAKKKAKRARRPVALITSDNHLQDRAWASRTTLEHDAYFAFDWMLEYASKKSIPNVIIAGDVIDRQKNEAEIANFVREQMQFCEDNQIGVFYIQGQHEMQPGTPWLSAVHRWPRHLHEEEELVLGAFRTWGIDWTPIEELPDRLGEVPEDTDLLVMHQVCDEWMGSITNPELRWSQIPHAWLLVVGDYHKFSGQVTGTGANGQRLRILSPGATAMQAIDEPPDKYCHVLYDDKSIEQVRIPTRIMLKPPDLMSNTDVDKFVENVEGACKAAAEKAAAEGLWDELCKPIVYVRYQFDISDAYKRLDRAIGEHGHFFYKELMPKTDEQIAAHEERQKVIEGGLVGALPQVVEDAESDAYYVSKRLLESRNVAGTLIELRQEYLADETEEAGAG